MSTDDGRLLYQPNFPPSQRSESCLIVLSILARAGATGSSEYSDTLEVIYATRLAECRSSGTTRVYGHSPQSINRLYKYVIGPVMLLITQRVRGCNQE